MKYLTTLAVACLPFLLSAAHSTPPGFLEGSPPEAQRMAAREGKLYFIFFAADWCMPSQWMEEQTFRDETLAAFLEKNYLALRADVDLPEGKSLKERYAVRILPSVLVFSARGQLLGSHEGAIGPEALQEQLKAYPIPDNRRQFAGGKDILDSPRPVFALSRPALIPDAAAGTPAAALSARPSRPALFSTAASPSRPSVPPSQFTIQVGVFSSYSNAVRHCAALEDSVKLRTEISPCQLNGQNRYKVFLGLFGSQEEAEGCLERVRRNGIDGFVKIAGH
ncbi:MAG: thioredoxin family protein [Phaeodactylibacter sp.]|nr:thioredoxin family protein [Phaeodactylibacter sp.]MCB9297470.1 thioredoxin family protein [Lewinellaceae bacterium]